MSQNLLEQFDHEMLRHSVSIMERRNELETKMRSILFRDALGEDAYNHELSMLLHLDCEYERRTLTKEKELAVNDPSSFVPDPYFLQSTANPAASQENPQIPPQAPFKPLKMPKFQALQQLWTLTTMTLTLKTISTEFSTCEDEEEILPIQDPELQTSSQREENKDSVHPPVAPPLAPPIQENDLQPILETHYMKSPDSSPTLTSEVQCTNPKKWLNAGRVSPRSINQVFGRPEAVENGTFEASTSQNWSFEHNSLSHLPPKLRLTRARLQLPLVQALDNGTRSLNEGEKLKPLEQTVGFCWKCRRL
uniref:Uncharacterized protein n=1 Tax=Ditylenchus dipsaci TaxID=166011 RepID=A0A915D5C4_9BILA